jgi:hypothetical protein
MIQIARALDGAQATDYTGTKDAAAQVVITGEGGAHIHTELLTRAQLTAFLTAGLGVLGEHDRAGRPWNKGS